MKTRKKVSAGKLNRLLSIVLGIAMVLGINITPLTASAQTAGTLREHAPVAAEPRPTAANVISSDWIELFLPGADGFNKAAAPVTANYSVTSVLDRDFAAPVTPAAANYRWWSEEAPYDPTYTWQDWGAKDMMNYQTIYRIYLQLPADKQLKEGYTYYVSVAPSVGVGVSFTAEFDASEQNAAIHVNQESYLQNGSKIAYLSWWTGDGGDGMGDGSVNFDAYTSFQLVDESTGASVFAGPVTLLMRGADERWGKADYYSLDFTSFTTPGSYHIYIPGVGISYSFQIGDQAFRDSVGYTVFRGLLMERDGAAGVNGTGGPNQGDGPVPNGGGIGSGFAGLDTSNLPGGLDAPSVTNYNRPAAHTQDALDENSSTAKGTTDSVAGMQMVDLTGGHMDAGDRGKYPYNVSNVSSSLLAAATLFPDAAVAFGDNLNLPESGDGIPDYLNEIVYELDFLYKAVMNTSKDGALPEYLRPFTGYSGTTPQGGYESDLDAFGNPQRIIFNDNTDGGTGEQAHGVLRAQTLYAAGALAMACNTPLMQEYFPQRCANYLAAARKAFSAFQNHWSDNSWWRADPGPDNYTVDMVAAGQIPHTWSDEMLFAASNLLEVDTLDPANSDGMENTYAGWINSEWPSIPLDNCMLYGWSLEGPWYNLFLSLSDCQSPLLDSAKRAEARKAITDWADTLYSNSPNAWEQRYGVPLWYELMGPQVGWYFSGSMVGFPLMMAYGVSGDSKYLDTLETTWNYLLGTNPTSRSFISGLGAPATSPHYFVSEISKYEVSQYDLSGGAQGWADVAPGLPVADVQNYMFKSQWGAAFSSQGNRDKEELGGYPDTQSPNDPITANKYFAPLWRYQDSWNVDNEFVIGDIARQAASILPLIGTQADPAVRQADLSLSKNGAFTLEAAEGYGSLPVTVTAKNTGFSDMTALSVSLSGDNSADFAVTTAPAPSLAKDASTGFAVSPVAGLPIGRYTASVVVSGTDVNGSSVTRTLGLVFNVTAPITSARLSDNADGTVDLTDQGYAFPSLGVGYASADTLTVKLSNTGTQAIAGISVSADGTNPDDFTITQPNDSVAAGDSVTFAVTPNAGLDVGIYAARINVAASGFSAYVDVSFEVYEIEPAFGLFAGSDEIGGGTVTLKTLGKNYTDPSQAAGTFAVENTGKGAVTGLSAAVTSGGAYFAVTAQPSASVADRDSTSFTVTPNSGLAIGLYSGAITVTSGNAGQQTFDVTFRVYPYDIGAAVITDSSPTAYDVSVSDGDDPNSYADDLIDMSMAPGNHWYGGMFVSPWAGDDEFAYTYLDNLTGDTEVVAEITDPGNLWAGGNDARAGLMIRQGMGTQDPYYGIFIKGGAWSDTDPVNEIVTQSRQTSGGLAVYDYRSGASQWDPIWLKLTLSGGVVTASTSADGATWTVIDSQTCPVSGTYTAGLAVNGQFYGAPMTGEATFTNVQIGSGTPAGQPYPVTVLSSANGTVTSDKASAAEGETVTLTAAPDAGFELDTLTVTNDSTSEAVAVTNPAGAAYAFAMPDSGVTVSASFKETPAPSGIWKNKDIGTCQAPGSTAETDGSGAYSFVIDTTSIGELVYQADNFRYVYQDSLTGDQTIAGRVDQFTDPNGAAPHSSDKAGLMVRQDDLGFDESGDYSQWCGVFLSDGKIIWINKNGQYNTTVDNSLTAAAPVWLKLAKTGDTVTAWYSTDDVTSADQVANWVQVNSMTYSMNDPFAMGMAVSGYMYDGGTYQVWSPAHAEFSGVQLTPGNAPAVDKAALEAAVENALLLSEADYTADSWAVFESALADAEAVLADGNATQNEVNAALEALISAESDLVAAPAGEAALVSISVAAQPKLIYTELETLDLSGLSVTLSCDDGSSNTVAYADFADNGVTLAYSNGKPAAQGDVLTVSAHNGLMIVIFCDGLTAFTGALVVSMNSAYDLNGDGKVNSNDLAFLMTYLGKKASSSAAAMKCDLDGNGVVDASDYALLSAYIAAVAAATP